MADEVGAPESPSSGSEDSASNGTPVEAATPGAEAVEAEAPVGAETVDPEAPVADDAPEAEGLSESSQETLDISEEIIEDPDEAPESEAAAAEPSDEAESVPGEAVASASKPAAEDAESATPPLPSVDPAVTEVLAAAEAAVGAVPPLPAEPVSAVTAAPMTPAAEAAPVIPVLLAEAPAEHLAPTKKHRRAKRALWIGIPSALVVGLAAAASLVLIAPGVAIAGVGVGGMTAGAATDALTAKLAETSLVFTSSSGDVTLKGSDLGVSVDAAALAQDAYKNYPLWKVGSWFPDPVTAPVSLDEQKATAALRKAFPSAYRDPIDATVQFDTASQKYKVTPSQDGTMISLDAVRTAIIDAVNSNHASATLAATPVPKTPAVTTAAAGQASDELGKMVSEMGFYVGDERVVPVDPATAATWVALSFDDKGGHKITANTALISKAVEGLAPAVNRDAVDGIRITNSSGDVLREERAPADGRKLGDTSTVARDFAAQLATGNARFALPVTVTPAKQQTLQRSVDVDLSAQQLYMIENGNVVDSWAVSTGRAGYETHTGNYRVGWKTTSQTMRGDNNDGTTYEQPDVKWVMYFNGDEAFHGVYWHDNWGYTMSHGCVGMPEWRAQNLYNWTPQGVDVSIHY